MKEINEIKTYKGFDKNLKCSGQNYEKQYELGGEYSEPEAIVCKKGLHSCENPLDVLRYYPPASSRYAETLASGKVDRDGKDSKVCSTHLKIGVELNLHKLIEAGVKFIFDRTTKSEAAFNSGYMGAASNSGARGAASNSGDRGAASNSGASGAASNSGASGAASNSGDRGAASNSGASGAASNSGDRGAASNSGDSGAAFNSGYSGAAFNSGYMGAASNSGDRGAASNSGDRGAASNSGASGAAFTNGSYSAAETNAKNSVAVAVGYGNKVKASLGSWLVIAERNDDFEILNIISKKVDGKKIKADTFYKLVGGKLIED